MSRWVLLPGATVCVLAGVLCLRFLTADRDVVAATPSPRPIFVVTYVPIPPGERLCLSDVTIPDDARRLRVKVRTYSRPGPGLDVALRGRGYTQALAVAGGYRDGAVIDAPMRPPPEARLGQVCLRQDGTRPVALVGTTEERTLSRPEGAIDGKPIPADTYLAFYEAGSASALHETGAIVDRMSAFRPGIVGPWLLWPLLVLVVLGVPCGVVWAALRAVHA
jgi:hypothetical protein